MNEWMPLRKSSFILGFSALLFDIVIDDVFGSFVYYGWIMN